MSNISYVTEEGLLKLKEELDHLINIERPNISKSIAEARDKGDLSENAEYDAAKDAQGMLELKIAKLKETLANSRVLDETKIDTSKVQILNKVKIRNKKNDSTMVYTIVSESEADLKAGKISAGSPIGKGLMGKAKGEVAEVQAPTGIIKFKIEDITV